MKKKRKKNNSCDHSIPSIPKDKGSIPELEVVDGDILNIRLTKEPIHGIIGFVFKSN